MTTRHYIYIAVTLGVGLLVASLAGCDLGDLIQTKTPTAIQQATGEPSSMTVNEAEAAYKKWLTNVQADGAQWKASIEKSNEVRGLLTQLTLGSLSEIGPSIAGVSVIGPAMPVILGLGGLFLGRSGLGKEKIDSYNKGKKDTVLVAEAFTKQGTKS